MVLLRERPDLRVAIFEGSRTEWASRPLEILAPGGRTLLEHCGAWEALGAFMTPVFGSSAAWGAPEVYENDFIFSARGPAHYVERGAFDTALQAVARQRGAAVFNKSTLVSVERTEDDGWALHTAPTDDRGPAATWLARIIVDATGPRAAVASRCGARSLVYDMLVGIGTRCTGGRILAQAPTFVEADELGWWYSAQNGQYLTVIFMTDADLARAHRLRESARWLRNLASTRQTSKRATDAGSELTITVRSARTRRLERAVGMGWIAVGDAAASFDPLSSSGILNALRSGTLGAFAVLDSLQGRPSGIDIYQRCLDTEFTAYLAARRELYAAEQRWPLSPFWSRRSGS